MSSKGLKIMRTVVQLFVVGLLVAWVVTFSHDIYTPHPNWSKVAADAFSIGLNGLFVWLWWVKIPAEDRELAELRKKTEAMLASRRNHSEFINDERFKDLYEQL